MRGFKITLENEDFRIRFYHNQEMNTVVCVLENEWGDIFRGKAKCNTKEGDIYDEKTGEGIALKKALEKLDRFSSRCISSTFWNRIKQIKRIDNGLFGAWERRRVKEDKDANV